MVNPLHSHGKHLSTLFLNISNINFSTWIILSITSSRGLICRYSAPNSKLIPVLFISVPEVNFDSSPKILNLCIHSFLCKKFSFLLTLVPLALYVNGCHCTKTVCIISFLLRSPSAVGMSGIEYRAMGVLGTWSSQAPGQGHAPKMNHWGSSTCRAPLTTINNCKSKKNRLPTVYWALTIYQVQF